MNSDEALIEVERLRALNAQMLAVLEAVWSAGDVPMLTTPWYGVAEDGVWTCFECQQTALGDHTSIDHKPDCAWADIRAAIKAGKEAL